MTGTLRILLVLATLSTAALAQGTPDDPTGKERDRVKMGPRPGKKDGGKKTDEKKEPEEKVDPFQAALDRLKNWPGPDARDAAATLALEGPEAEKPLIAALKTATPAQAAGISFILGEVGGDASVPALQAVAARPAMSDHLGEVFTAIGKLEGENAVRRILPFLRHPRRAARSSAETWLRDHVNESHATRLEAFLKEPSIGARVSAFRLLVRVAPDRAYGHAFDLLGDDSWELCRAAGIFLAENADDKGIEKLEDMAMSVDGRVSAYSVLTLVVIEDRRQVRILTPRIIEMLLTTKRGILSMEKLNRGAAAIALARVGHETDNPAVEKLLDREIIDILLDTLGGKSFYKDYPAIHQLARDRFALLTGILDRRPIPELWRWWAENREGFVARRSLRVIDPDNLRTLRVRGMSAVEPALSTTYYSTVAEDALKPEMVGIGFVYLLDRDARALAAFLSREFLALPDSGILDPTRVIGGEGRGFGPEVYVTVTFNGRSRTAAARRDTMPEGLTKIVRRLRDLRDLYVWQQYWDRDTYRRFEDFIETEGAFFSGGHTPEEDAARLKGLILAAMDDLVTREEQIAALDLLNELNAPLTDSDCYRIAIFLGGESALNPFSRRAAKLLADSGRPIVVALLTEWVSRFPGKETIQLLSDALVNLGTLQVQKSAKSSKVVVRRAAFRAAPRAIEGEQLVSILKAGAADKVVAVRREAILALGRSPSAVAIPILTVALADQSDEIRNTAVEALGMLAVPDVVPLLTKQLNSKDPGLRVAAVRALAASELDEAVTPVLLALRSDASPVVREIAADVVTGFGVRAVEALTRIALDLKEKPAVRALALEAIVTIGGPLVVDLLGALVEDEAAEVADAAAVALASMGRKDAVPRLLAALDAGRRRSDAVAGLEALSCQTFPSARTGDLKVIYRGWWDEHKNESPGQWFADALDRKGYGSPWMESLARGEPDRRLTPLLIGAFSDEDWFIRTNANLWLTRITGEDFGRVDRFTPPLEIRALQERWRTWWEKR